MQVETFEVAEIGADLAPERDADAIALIESLGLEGQLELVTKPESVATRNPYRLLTREEQRVYGLLFPKKVALNRYADGHIPLRVLQVAAHAREHFQHLVIWCPETSTKDDPILLGYNSQHWSFMTDGGFLLARWGECLKPFAELAKEATALARDRVRDALTDAKRALDLDLASWEQWSDERMLAAAFDKPSYHPTNFPR